MAVLATREQRTALLADLYWAAVTAAAPGPALSAALASHPSEPKRRVHLLALGKAAYPMAVAAVAALSERDQDLAGGLLVTPEPTPSPDPRLGVAVGDHPEPGPGSFRAAELLQAAVARVQPDDEVWVLLSGGATSLLAAPVPPLTYPEPDGTLPNTARLWARHNRDESRPQAFLALGRRPSRGRARSGAREKFHNLGRHRGRSGCYWIRSMRARFVHRRGSASPADLRRPVGENPRTMPPSSPGGGAGRDSGDPQA